MSTLSVIFNKGRFGADGIFPRYNRESTEFIEQDAPSKSDKDRRSLGRLSTRISPPPLSRQRVQSKVSTPTSGPTQSEALQSRGVKRSLSDITGPDILLKCLKRACPIITPPASSIHESERSASLSQSSVISTPSLETDIKKRKCRACNKPSTKRFDPIISCLGCNRPFHESCRTPALKEEVSGELWRCLKCLIKSREWTRRVQKAPQLSRTGTHLLPGQYSTSFRHAGYHIPSSLVTKVEHDTVLAETADFKRSFSQSAALDQHRKVQGWLGVPAAADRSGYQLTTHNDDDTAVKPETWKEARSEVLNTPPRHRSKYTSIKSLSEPSPVSASPTEAGDDERKLSEHKKGALTTLCSVCLTQRVFVETPGKDMKCRQCRIRASFSEDGTTEIPETPHVAPVQDSAVISSPSRPIAEASVPVALREFASEVNSKTPALVSRSKPQQQQSINKLAWRPKEVPSPSQEIHVPKSALDHTERERFILRIAKLALDASGGRLTASKIIKWAAGDIVQLNLADGALEKYLVSVLSASPEFFCIVIDGIKGKEQLWRLANKEKKVNNEPTVSAKTNAVLEGSVPYFMPFERSSPRRTQKTTFYNAQPGRGTLIASRTQSSIETMTHAEKLQKIQGINARPSRKSFFGSDHRLAHVRKSRGDDVHDESHGAWKWKPRILIEGKEDEQTLRDVLRLPDNVIPMNDGQTELAFRDGTKIKGRLPRPRQIYRVGKLFGGELTVRTS